MYICLLVWLFKFCELKYIGVLKKLTFTFVIIDFSLFIICFQSLTFVFRNMKENKFKVYKWKLIHYILPCKELLFKWHITTNNLCNYWTFTFVIIDFSLFIICFHSAEMEFLTMGVSDIQFCLHIRLCRITTSDMFLWSSIMSLINIIPLFLGLKG
jgi:hypothetical protein